MTIHDMALTTAVGSASANQPAEWTDSAARAGALADELRRIEHWLRPRMTRAPPPRRPLRSTTSARRWRSRPPRLRVSRSTITWPRCCSPGWMRCQRRSRHSARGTSNRPGRSLLRAGGLPDPPRRGAQTLGEPVVAVRLLVEGLDLLYPELRYMVIASVSTRSVSRRTTLAPPFRLPLSSPTAASRAPAHERRTTPTCA